MASRRSRDALPPAPALPLRPAAGGHPPPEVAGRSAADGRLDPIRWRRPGRAGLIRLGAIALLLVTAAGLVLGREPAGCAPAASTGTSPSSKAGGSRGAAPIADAGGAPGDAGAAGRSVSRGPGAVGGARRARSVPKGSVGVPVRLAEPAALGVLQPGDRVDLMAARDDGKASRIATAALVLGVGHVDDPGAGLFLALTAAEARAAAAAPDGARLSVLVRPPE
ncbi:hypothetical protein [Spirilliplanes yamanashiensis]|uniref:Flp pilus assembly protein RcpC/CpaB domain-containing protein n=1 Tax=Spirilliplanes yamanashiensis TaxID=42233 RepID=A0A8J4DFV9_9ACTN|nr:hypothetical protein [Spirilliplanes yamanashiensis]MDP9814256.1 hypothetical protein [Spirilliplanes yamanashiensis]GIJ00761.1 hypothetical protein Sya03_01130 [Spirilliplanes yamanashiensis]